ncbi:hypothetical protein [Marinoscillum sp.]|uniref:hypothetical protein n=1 Tax=Marinoscillum sp. TaxID=2024838 RepID=UPI003BABAC59
MTKFIPIPLFNPWNSAIRRVSGAGRKQKGSESAQPPQQYPRCTAFRKSNARTTEVETSDEVSEWADSWASTEALLESTMTHGG